MKALLVSSDQTILDRGSSGYVRAKDNALALGELFVLLPGEKAEDIEEGSLRIRIRPEKKLFGETPLITAGISLVEENNITIIWSQDAFERGVIAAAIAERTRRPLCVTVDTDFLSPWYARSGMFRSTQVKVPKINAQRRRWADEVLPKAQAIRVLCGRVKEALVAHYGDTIVTPTIIPIPVHTALPAQVPFPVKPFPFTLMAAGRLDTARRVVDIIDAIARIHDKYPGVGLFVVGDGPEREHLEKHARKCGVADQVIFLGDRRDTWGLMRSAHAFVQASAYEGYGRRLLQAALARVPIITTDVGIVGEVFCGYDTVLSFPPGDPATLAIHIVGLVEDGQARMLLAMNAQHAARTFFEQAGDVPQRVATLLRETAEQYQP